MKSSIVQRLGVRSLKLLKFLMATGRVKESAFVPRALTESSLDQFGNVALSKGALLFGVEGSVWTAYPPVTVIAQIAPRLTAGGRVKNCDKLRNMLAKSSFEAAPLKFGRFLNCIAHPYAVSLVTADGKVLSETLRVYRYIDPSLERIRFLSNVNGTLVQAAEADQFVDEDVIIPLHASIAFGHCIFDGVPQILAFEHEIKAGKMKVVLPDFVPVWFQGILSAWKFLPHHFIILPTMPEQVHRFRSVIVSNALTTMTTFFPNPLTFERYQNSLSHIEPIGGRTPSLLYLRRNAEHTYSNRAIENEEELISRLREVGCKIIDPAELSFEEQIANFKGADVVIAGHGSAFANLIWCRPGTRVIDLMPDDWIGFWSDHGVTEVWIHRICALNNLRYDVVLCDSSGSDQSWRAGGTYKMVSRVQVDTVLSVLLND